MTQIRSNYSREKNKDIILYEAFRLPNTFKSHLQKRVVSSNWDYYMNNMFDSLFRELINEDKIIYNPHKYLEKGSWFMEEKKRLKIPRKECSYCSHDMFDKTEGTAKEPLFECCNCFAVFWKKHWWDERTWKKQVEIAFCI